MAERAEDGEPDREADDGRRGTADDGGRGGAPADGGSGGDRDGDRDRGGEGSDAGDRDRGRGVARAWAKEADDVARRLDVDPSQGLDDAEVKRRRRTHGRNRLRQTQRVHWSRILRDQFQSVVILLLVAAAVVSLVFARWLEAIAIAVVILVNTALGFGTELRAIRSMEALRTLASTGATVRRGGRSRSISAEDLVPGDVVLLEAGDVVTADLRVVEASGLEANESTLTGESVPVRKQVEPVDADAPLAERPAMLFKGTAISRGSGAGIVVASGMATELGRIASLTDEADRSSAPLEHRLERLGRQLAWITIGIAAAVIGIGILRGKDTLVMAETGIALAVAAIPEGLPIVATLAMARGMQRMARRNALVERLAAVETLGATSVILTDKTGTLTENQMTVTRIVLDEGTIEVSGHGLEPEGDFTRDDESLDPEAEPSLKRALEIGVLCVNASLEREDDRWEGVGDPMEVALIVAGRKAGLERAKLLEAYPEQREVAFDPDTRAMATFHARPDAVGDGGDLWVAVKGSPDSVIDDCDRVRRGDELESLDDAGRDQWHARSDELADEGLRVLALAERSADSADEEPYEGLTLVGLVAMLDPPREAVREALERCRAAGIRVVMVTGDQPGTAASIAAALGMVREGDPPPVTGRQLAGREWGDQAEGEGEGDPDGHGRQDEDDEDDEDDEEAEEEEERGHDRDDEAADEVDDGAARGGDSSPDDQALLDTVIFARMEPEQKLRLIELHQSAGSIVAMTGDGVNDAPALEKADIGIAMGRRGEEAAKEAADMVLQDDDFSTIVEAVRGGRTIFANIRRSVMFMLCTNIAEVMAVSVAAFVGWTLPLRPLQILYLNVLTDVFPALALGIGAASGREMDRPPRDPSESVLTRRHWMALVIWAAIIATCVLGSMLLAMRWLGLGESAAVTVSFLALGFGKLGFTFNLRDRRSGPLRNEITGNPWVWGAIVLCTLLLLAAVWLPGLSDVLEAVPPGPRAWGLVAGAALAPLLVGQAWLLVRGGMSGGRGAAASEAEASPRDRDQGGDAGPQAAEGTA